MWVQEIPWVWCKNLHNFKQRNDHKKYKYYIAKKHKKTKKYCCPLKSDFTSILWKCMTWHCLQKKQNIHMQALKSLTHIQEIKFKWNAPSSKDSVLSLCFLFSAMTSFSDHFWPKISKTIFFKIDNKFFFKIDNKILAWL